MRKRKRKVCGGSVWKGLKRSVFFKKRTPFSFQLLQAPKMGHKLTLDTVKTTTFNTWLEIFVFAFFLYKHCP
jgi:hypothetical protein